MNPRPARLALLRPLLAAGLVLATLPLAADPQAKKSTKQGSGASAAPATPGSPAAKPTPAPSSAPEGVAPFEVVADEKAGLWFGRFGLTNCSWVDMGDGVAVIDSGATEGDAKNLLAEIKARTKGRPIRWIVLTHLHGDSNSGLGVLLNPDVTVFVHARSSAGTAAALGKLVKTGRRPTVVGVSGRTTLATEKRRMELIASPTAAHTGADLVAWLPDSAAAFVGDLVTPARCPMTSDAQCDPVGWTEFLGTLEGLHAATLIPTRGNATLDPAAELLATKSYLKRLMDVLTDFKAKGLPEARLAAELTTLKLGDYCPLQLDNLNALSLYRRIDAEGKFPPPSAPAGPAPVKEKPLPKPK